MAKIRIQADSKGIQEILTRQLADEIFRLTRDIAADAAARSGLPADGRIYDTDRAHGVAMITHPGGAAKETKDAPLRKAAMVRGLEVDS